MNSKTISNYVIGAVAGVGLTVGSVAFAVNTNNHHNGGPMGTPIEQTTQSGMHGQTAQTGMHGKFTQGGMNGQTMSDGIHKGMTMGSNGQTPPCHATTDSKDTKS